MPKSDPLSNTYTINTTGAAAIPGPIFSGNTGLVFTGQAHANVITGVAPMVGAGGNISIGAGGFGTFAYTPPPNILSLQLQGKEIVKLNTDGSVVWANGINIDEAAEAFARSLSLSAELMSGITKTTKRKMRDSVFEDLIKIAEEKGSLTAEDLTYLLQASKIVEKLKGGKE